MTLGIHPEHRAELLHALRQRRPDHCCIKIRGGDDDPELDAAFNLGAVWLLSTALYVVAVAYIAAPVDAFLEPHLERLGQRVRGAVARAWGEARGAAERLLRRLRPASLGEECLKSALTFGFAWLIYVGGAVVASCLAL